MLDRIQQILSEVTNKESFFRLIGKHYPRDDHRYKEIKRAYDVAHEAFLDKKRDDATQYFDHIRAVAVLLISYLRIRDYHLIIAALLHDIIEDVEGWTYERIRAEFGVEVSQYVWWLSKPVAEEFGKDKAARNRFYHHRLQEAPREVIIIKLTDRLHNLLTLWSDDLRRRRRKIEETQDFYIPLAEKHTILIWELEELLDQLTTENEEKEKEKTSA